MGGRVIEPRKEVTNECGEILIKTCETYALKIKYLFYYKNMHRYTWERTSLHRKSIIDHIIVKNTKYEYT